MTTPPRLYLGGPDVTQYGAKGDGTTDDTLAIQAAINDTISNGIRSMQLVPGATYRITKKTTGSDGSAVALKIVNATEGFVLDGQGAALVFDGATPADYATVFRIENSSRVTLKNFTVDWSKLPFTQATCAAVGANYADFQTDALFPFTWTTVQSIEEFTPPATTGETPLWVKTIFSWDRGTGVAVNRSITSLGGGAYRVDFSGDMAALADLTVGAWYFLDTQRYGAECVDAYKVDDLVIDNVRFYCTAGLGMRHWEGTNLVVKNGAGSHLKPGSGRFRSVTADGAQVAFVRGAVVIDDYRAECTGDDALNVFGLFHSVVSVTSLANFVLSPVTYAPYHNPRVGDTLQFVDPNGEIKGTARVATVSGSLGSNITITTSTNAPVGFTTTWIVANKSAVPAELIVRNSQFRYIRGQGIISHAQKNLITTNRFDRVAGCAVLMMQAPSIFSQGPAPQDITISNNVMEDCNTVSHNQPGIVSIFAYNLALTLEAPPGTISGVSITGNTFRRHINMGAFVAGADDVMISGNLFDRWAQTGSDGVAWRAMGGYAIGTAYVEDLNIGTNTYVEGTENHFSVYAPTSNPHKLRAAGAQVASNIPSGSAVALTTDTDTNLTAITFSPGRWLIWGQIAFDNDATTVTNYVTASTSLVSATGSTNGQGFATVTTAGAEPIINTGPQYYSFAAQTAVYLVVRAGFSVSTCKAYGALVGARLPD